MTADGTDDELIKLEGWPEGKKYEFMDVELDDDSGSDADEELMRECWVSVPEIEPPIPDQDGEDAVCDAEFEEISNEPHEIDLAEEPLIVPNGFTTIAMCPDICRLSGKKIMFLWDFGWDIGTVKKKIRNGQYNYFVQYANDDGTFSEYRQNLTSETYYNDDENTGYWIALRKES